MLWHSLSAYATNQGRRAELPIEKSLNSAAAAQVEKGSETPAPAGPWVYLASIEPIFAGADPRPCRRKGRTLLLTRGALV